MTHPVRAKVRVPPNGVRPAWARQAGWKDVLIFQVRRQVVFLVRVFGEGILGECIRRERNERLVKPSTNLASRRPGGRCWEEMVENDTPNY